MAHRVAPVKERPPFSPSVRRHLFRPSLFQRFLAQFRSSWHILLVLALPVLLLSPSLFGGRALTADDNLLLWPPWSSDLASLHLAPQNTLLADGPQNVEAWLFFTHQQLAAGRLPLWDPLEAGGAPFLAAGQPAVLSPFTWLAALLPYPLGLALVVLLRWWLVGLGMYVFARVSLRLVRVPALIPALAFMLGSFWVVWLIHEVDWPVTFLPWLLWATERLIRQPSARRLVVLALVAGLIGVSGHPEMSFHVMLGGGLYACWLGMSIQKETWRARVSGFGLWCGGAVLGVLLAAIQYLPTLALVPTAMITAIRGTQPSAPVPLSGLPTWIVPNIGGNQALHMPYWGPWNYNEAVFYAGGVSLVLATLALGGLRSPGRRADVIFFTALAMIMAGLVYGMLPFSWLTRLPVLDTDAWERLNVLVIFSIACLAGIGLEQVSVWKKPSRILSKWAARRRFVGWLLLWLAALAAALALVETISNLSVHKVWTALWVALAVASLWGAGVVLVCQRYRWLGWRKVQGALLGLVLLDLLLFAVPYVPQPSARVAFPKTPTIVRLQQTIGPARMAASGDIIPPDTGTPYGLHDLRAYNPLVSDRYMHYMVAMEPDLAGTFCCVALACPSLTLLSVASVAYYATLPNVDANRCARLAPGQSLTSGPLVPLWTQGGITLWRNTQARPRFYFADMVIASASAQQTAALLPGLSSTGRDAIIEGASASASAPLADAGAVKVVTDAPGQITLQTQTNTTRWLVIDEGYDIGWQADVDGARTTVHPANEMFQAVEVPAGAHTIHLLYRPVSFTQGAALSALALLVLLGLLLGSWVVPPFFRRVRPVWPAFCQGMEACICLILL
ncbi:MAG TPA: YfhO family protein [Ktedonobacterales bacterium]|nr:YfhO family protein [Ktedonobacterales bacterium]